MLNYLFSLSPYTTENSKTVFHRSFLYSISKKKHQLFLSNCGHTAVLCHIRPHSRCSTISSASAHKPQRSPRPSFISRFLTLWAKEESLLSDYRHTAALCHIRPHSRCSTISSASTHTQNNSLSVPNVNKPTTRGTGEIILTRKKQCT